MEFIPVHSSSIRAVAYEGAQLLLQVEFQDREIYEYAGVPPAVFSQLLAAASIGGFFNAHIRNGAFACRRVNQAD